MRRLCVLLGALTSALPVLAQGPRAPEFRSLDVRPLQQPTENAFGPGRLERKEREVVLDLSPEERDNVRVYQQSNRSVVHIMTRIVRPDDFFLFGKVHEGAGSGCVLDRKGHVLTNYHVVEGAQQVAVTLYDGSMHFARRVGVDPNNDLAVLQIEAPEKVLQPIRWGDSSRLMVGLRVFSIGNPFGLERTLTTGIISGLNRSLRTENNRVIRGVIQTDAAINPGNSGGPLLNRRGQLIGITTAIKGRTGQNSGVGLAIPANTARRVVHELIRFGRVIRADCGIASVLELDEGLLISRLTPEGPAERAGLRGPQLVVVQRGNLIFRGVDRSKADLVVAVDDRPVRSLEDLFSYVESKRPGERVILTIVRQGVQMRVPVQLEQARQ